ncbi:hypothetical protein [Streptomyces sp. NBC_00063]|uniref:hypothetical protein n=1 Tax=Streptomyces sp. NBC_00063 TaxID=2975638 RepID=UPI00224CD1CD|nr:hypothetical protein [Streptomyces sp. NBC_00063]MCX5443912.1 hypothetical protein [Streptomyces sp. NBC_00063]
MDGFLSEVGKKATERWLTRLILPGLLFVVACAVALTPGRSGPVDTTATIEWLEWLRTGRYASPSGRAAALVILLLAVAGSALGADWLASGVRRLWEGRALWLRRAVRRLSGSTEARARATWIGARLGEVEERIRVQHGVHMSLVWPRLWQLAPDGSRQEVNAAWDRYAAAALRTAWMVPYTALAVVTGWWPAVVIAAGLLLTGWREGRAAVAGLIEAVEAAVDTGLRGLAETLGVPLRHGWVHHADGVMINELLNKGR